MIVNKIKDKYAYAMIDCCDERCKIRIDTKKNFVILKGELLATGTQKNKMCDCIIFQDDGKISHIELKSRSLNVAKIIEKFDNGWKSSCKIARAEDPNSDFGLFFILLAKLWKSFCIRDAQAPHP